MTTSFLNKYDNLILGTGNVLEQEEFRKAKSSTHEMLICLKSRIDQLQVESLPDEKSFVALRNDEINEHATATKTVAKIFMNKFYDDSIEEAIKNILKSTKTIPSVILAYHPTNVANEENGEPIYRDKFVWGDTDTICKEHFKKLWNQLRKAVADGRIAQLGIADMGLETILEVFENDVYDFTTLQINLATCCVVPPELQLFCKEHEIQLLTHNDPQEILPAICLKELGLEKFTIKWSVRYLTTLIERGILAEKGFVVNFIKKYN